MLKNYKVKTKNLIILLINIAFIVSFLFWSLKYLNNEENITNPHELLFMWICTLVIIQMICFRLKRVSIYDFGLWFVIISYFFMFGFIFIDGFDLESSLVWNPIKYYNYNELFKAYSFAILALNCFSTGYLIIYDKKKSINKQEFCAEAVNKKMYFIGVFLSIISVISKFITDIKMIVATQGANSYTAYSTATSTGIFDDLAYLCLPSLFFVFYSGNISEKSKKRIFCFFIIYFVMMMLLTGSRKVQVFSILVLTLGYNFSIEKKNKGKVVWKFILATISLIILVNILIIIRNNRFELSTIIPTFIDNLLSLNLFKNILGEVFVETGITLLSVASIIKVVPEVMPFQYGLTFIRTIPSIMPIGWLIGDFFAKASSTNVINSYTKLPVGSSFIGDLYWNWGFLGGIIAAFIFGEIIAKLLKIDTTNKRFGYALYFSFFSQLIILVRAELFDIFRSLFMIWLVALIIKRIDFIGKKE